MTAQNKINGLIPLLPHKIQVSFALYCAKDAYEFTSKKDKKVVDHAISLIQKWIEIGGVSVEELHTAAYAAYAASSASSAAYAASSAAYAASSASSASFAAYAAAYAASSAAYAAVRESKYEEYLGYLIKISNFTDL